VVWPQRLLGDRQGPLIEGLGSGVLALAAEKHRQVVEACSYFGVVRSQHPLPDRQGLLIEGLGRRVLPLGAVEFRQVVEARGHIRVLWTQHLLPDRECPLKKGLSFGKARAVLEVISCLVEKPGGLRRVDPPSLNEGCTRLCVG
jgi:hypothetical protein